MDAVTMDAVTTAKWNHRKEELLLRFAGGDNHLSFKRLGSMPRKIGIEPKESVFS